MAGVLVAVPALAAGVTVAALPAAATSAASTVTVSRTDCAPEWSAAKSGTQTITVTNNSGLAGEVNLDNAAGAVVGEIETIGPGTSAPLTATLGAGTYTLRCLMGSQPTTASQPVTVSANTGTTVAAPVAVKPVTVNDLTPPNKLYQGYAAAQLTDLAKAVAVIEADLRHDKIPRPRRTGSPPSSTGSGSARPTTASATWASRWTGSLTACPTASTTRASPACTGLSTASGNGQPAKELLPVAETLAKNVATVQKNLTTDDLAGDPTQLPIRAHEIIEDALRDHLSGIDDEGAGAGGRDDLGRHAGRQGSARLPGGPDQRAPARPRGHRRQPARHAGHGTARHPGQRAVAATAAVTLDQRQHVDAATGALLETLATVPDLLEVPPAH